jgi:nucleoside-diphosphate-sugar epimerase
MKVLLTGASGRIGPPVIEALGRHHDLTLFSRTRVESPHPQMIGDLASIEDCLRALEGAEAVVHMAAGSMPGPDTFRFNLMSTYAMLEAARQAGIGRFIFASTNCVYGHCFPLSERRFPLSYLPIDEDHPCLPEDNYGLSKLLNEQLLSLYSRNWGIRTAAFRLSWVWGPEETHSRLQNANFDDSRNAPYFWAYVDARDVGDAFHLALVSPRMPDFGVYNIHAADHMSDLDSQTLIERYYPDVPLRSELPGKAAFFDCSRARRDFGFEPVHSWREGRA